MEKFKFFSKDKISKLPKKPGVYAFQKKREIFYIGKAANIKERVKNHLFQPTYRDNFFINQIEKAGFIKTNSEIEALILEAKLIKKYQPKYNIVWRDDKNYFFVGITKEDFPQLFIAHQLKIVNYKLKINYLGPFVDGKALKQTLKVLRKVFPYRNCNKIPKRPCLWYQLERCPAPCLLKSKTAEQIPKLEEKIKKECQENIKNIIKILKGKKIQVLKELKKEMKNASNKQDFERAAKIRDQISALKKVMEHSKIFEPIELKFSEDKLQEEKNWQKIQKFLKKILKTKKEISRIEAFDVSNIQGQKATGAMATFINGQPDKNFYRRFKIKIEGKPNDTAMLKEVLTRRFKHLEWGLPDLILIDGGLPQLSTALKLRSENSKIKNIKIVALAKKKNELFVEKEKKPLLLKNLQKEISNLILKLRDEAHRFAISYHRKLRHLDLKSNF